MVEVMLVLFRVVAAGAVTVAEVFRVTIIEVRRVFIRVTIVVLSIGSEESIVVLDNRQPVERWKQSARSNQGRCIFARM